MVENGGFPAGLRLSLSVFLNVILAVLIFSAWRLSTLPRVLLSGAATSPTPPNAPAALSATVQQSDVARSGAPSKDLAEFLKTYRAADPAYQDRCYAIISGQDMKGMAQYYQDVFLFRNLYLGKLLAEGGNYKGFYLDIGANEATSISNTLFFDKCLGWDGVCVEPQTIYHEAIRKERSCKLVPTCVSNTFARMATTESNLGGGGFTQMRAAGREDPNSTECVTLKWILTEYNIQRVDFLSIDVEGMELEILGGHSYNKPPYIEAIILEDFWLSNREVDYFMGMNGYAKYQQLAIDSIYVRSEVLRDPARKMGSEVFYPPGWDELWKFQQNWRYSTPDVRSRIKC